MKLVRTSILLVLAAAGTLLAQEHLTNDSVLKLVKAGIGDEIILSMIKSQPAKFSITPNDIIALKNGGVSDKVIAAIASKAGESGTAPAPAAPAAAAPTAPTPMVSEIGVYVDRKDKWQELSPEVVNFKTGGVLKSIGTAGIVKGDVNGRLNGSSSPNKVTTPVRILIYTPDGVNVTEYQLLKLREQKDSREFRTVTGGVFHVSGGATRDLLPFENKKVAPRTYEIVLPNVSRGEYGFLPPASSDATATTGRVGKIYSFSVTE